MYPIEIRIFSGRGDSLFGRLEDIDMLNLLLRTTKAFAQSMNDRSDRTQLDTYWDTYQSWLRCLCPIGHCTHSIISQKKDRSHPTLRRKTLTHSQLPSVEHSWKADNRVPGWQDKP